MNISLVVCCDRQKEGRPVLIWPVEGINEVPRVLAIIKRSTPPEILVDYDVFYVVISPCGDDLGGAFLHTQASKLSFDSHNFFC